RSSGTATRTAGSRSAGSPPMSPPRSSPPASSPASPWSSCSSPGVPRGAESASARDAHAESRRRRRSGGKASGLRGPTGKGAAARARVVEFFYDQPDAGLVEIVHRGGALACWQVGSGAEALAAAAAGCDLIVAQGTEAGGHVRGRIGLLPLLGEVLDGVDLPV